MRRYRVIERRTVFKAALATGAATMAAACTSGGDGGGGGQDTGGGAPAETKPVAVITAEPAVDARDVPVLQPVTVKVAQGTLTEVKLTNPDGKAVAGALSADKTTWTSSETLGYDKTYTYAASATGTDGKPVQLSGSFRTLKPASTARVTLNPADNATVGVGMPVSVKFTSAVKNKAAVERALKIETSTDVEGSWGGCPTSRSTGGRRSTGRRTRRSRSRRSSTAWTSAVASTRGPMSPPSSRSAATRWSRSTLRTTR